MVQQVKDLGLLQILKVVLGHSFGLGLIPGPVTSTRGRLGKKKKKESDLSILMEFICFHYHIIFNLKKYALIYLSILLLMNPRAFFISFLFPLRLLPY